MQIIRRSHDETRENQPGDTGNRFGAHMKTPGKSVLVVIITAVYLFVATGVAGAGIFGNQAQQSVSAIPADMGKLTDETIDTFALVYSVKRLKTEEYLLTMENREKIKTLLSCMGEDNIKKLNEAIYSGNTDQIVETVINLADENFGWEETALMAQWQ